MALESDNIAKETRHKITNMNNTEDVPTFNGNSRFFLAITTPPSYDA
jgi:hypothetical protein